MPRRTATLVAATVLAAVVGLPALGAAPASGASTYASASQAQPSHSEDVDYSALAAQWWRWVLLQPEATNPVTDDTGEDCTNRQRGETWFLAGTFGGGSVTRSCTIPGDKELFFPLVNAFYCALAGDPPEQRTVRFARGQVAFVEQGATGLSVTLDGKSVLSSAVEFEKSDVFRAVLPEGNLFGLPAGTVAAPCVDAGYYAFLDDLRPGKHVLHFTGSLPDSIAVDVTYKLTITKGH